MFVRSGTALIDIIQVRKFGNHILHVGQLTSNNIIIKLNDNLNGVVDAQDRMRLAANHTMTHILNLALRHEVGPKTDQKGKLFSIP